MAPLLCFVPFAAFLLWGAISPRSQWRQLAAWRYRHPEVNEPSDAAYAVTRVTNVIVLVGLVAAAIGIATAAGRDDTPAATRSGAAPSATADSTAALRAAFGADRAEFIPFLVQQSAPPRDSPGLRPMQILRRQAVEPNASPAWLPGENLAGSRTRLVVSVLASARPGAIVVHEAADRVNVTVYTNCVNCLIAPPSSAVPGAVIHVYLLPVRLDQPLGARPVIDGGTGAAIE